MWIVVWEGKAEWRGGDWKKFRNLLGCWNPKRRNILMLKMLFLIRNLSINQKVWFLIKKEYITSHLKSVNCHLTLFTYNLSSVTSILLPIIWYLLPITIYQSTVTYHLSSVNCQQSPVMCHLSLVTGHLSLITFHLLVTCNCYSIPHSC